MARPRLSFTGKRRKRTLPSNDEHRMPRERKIFCVIAAFNRGSVLVKMLAMLAGQTHQAHESGIAESLRKRAGNAHGSARSTC